MSKIKLLFYLVLWYFLQANATDWSEFVSQVEKAANESSTYVLKTNNNEYFENETTNEFIDYGTWDFIIAGGGTAGGVLANRLTEEKKFTVLVIEAGKEPPIISDVLGLASYLIYSNTNWGYNTTKQKNACLASRNQQCYYPRGKALGGTSVLNSGAYVRGSSDDYDRWANMGNQGWSYKDCLPYFKKSERADFIMDIDRDFHGFDGIQKIRTVDDTPILTSSLLQGFQSLDLNLIDFNGKSHVGVGRIPFYLDYNIRSSTAHSFLLPAKSRKNLNITMESLVTKVWLSSSKKSKADGVEFVKNGKKYFARAKKEVIVSAGSINSPQILMLSGIGPAEELKKHGIPLVAELPVGQNLYDHMVMPCIYEGPNDAYNEGFSMINSTSDLFINIILLHPKSVGTITLQSNNPKYFPLIDTNYLSDPRDVEIMYKAIQKLLKIVETDAFKKLNAELYTIPWPGCDENYKTLSRAWWHCGIRHIAYTSYHPIGTASMGLDPKTSVTNSHLKVHGFENLRVIDASVMPSTLSGHTNAATVMIAEKISDEIKAEHLSLLKKK